MSTKNSFCFFKQNKFYFRTHLLQTNWKKAALDAQKAKVVELRFFAGLTGDQVALALGVSPSTVARDWQFARAWLHREISRELEA